MITANSQFDFTIRYFSWPNYWEHHEEAFNDIGELIGRFDEIVQGMEKSVGAPFFVDIRRSNGDMLGVGVTRRQWMLMLTKGPFDTQYSLGNEQINGSIDYQPTATAMSRRYLISKSKAHAALRVWLETGELSTKIKWTTELY